MLLDFAPLPLAIGLLALLILQVLLYKRSASLPYLLFFSAFWVYLLMLTAAALFPIPIELNPPGPRPPGWETVILSQVNLMPLSYGGWYSLRLLYYEILNNVLLTVPFGLGINFLRRFKFGQFALLALGLGLFLELLQLAVSLLLNSLYRTVDINDVIWNTLGAWLGYGLFRLFAWLYRSGGLADYLENITINSSQ